MIAWGDFLLLLEGETVNLLTAENTNSSDIKLKSDNDIPILPTSMKKIKYNRFSVDYDKETEMMDSRSKVYEFKHRFEGKNQIEMQPCG